MPENKEIIIYCDANVYLDHFGSRRDKFRDLGDFAFRIFRRTLDCEFKIVISDWLLYELKHYIPKEKLQEFLEEFKAKNKIVKISKTEEDEINAKKYSTHFHDILHEILAKKAGATIFITRNIKDCINIDGLEIKLPENI